MNTRDTPNRPISRRRFLAGATVAGSVAALRPVGDATSRPFQSARRVPVVLFSKHLQWLDYTGMADAAAEVGFDGVELTVRRGGHVLPERVMDDLPRATEAVRAAGLDVHGLATNIVDPRDPLTEPILRTAAGLGITHYRLGYIRYDDAIDIPDQLDRLKPRIRDLAAMNQQYRIFGGMHNHTGTYVGGPIWDTVELLKGLNSRWIGCQFDTGNAFQAGRQDTWKVQARLMTPWTRMVAVKTQAEWGEAAWRTATPNRLGAWNVLVYQELLWYFRLLQSHKFAGPICAHYEFPLGGAGTGKRELTGMTRAEVFRILRRNLRHLRDLISDSGLA